MIVTLFVGLISLAAILMSFFTAPIWPWVAVGIIDVLLGFMLVSAIKTTVFPAIDGMSGNAADLLSKYPHYYGRPFAAVDASRSAALLQFVGIAVGAITAYRWGWYWIGLSVLNWGVMGYVATRYSPASLIAKVPSAAAAHAEIQVFLQDIHERAEAARPSQS